jgi:membrane carboxypeptidase/penicillin-binding protein
VSKKPRALQEPVAPTQNVNLKIDQKDSLEQAKLRRVRLLKRMLDEGLITKEEYNEKVDKILSE